MRQGEVIWNVLTAIVLMGVLGVSGLFAFIYSQPNAPVNPFPPPTMPAAMVGPSGTPTLEQLPPTWTPGVTPTFQPQPSDTPLPTPTAAQGVMDSTNILATATVGSVSSTSFVQQSVSQPISASVLYPAKTCQWVGVGGQVVDLPGRPITGSSVQLGGSINGASILRTSLTGTALKYGKAGYEFTITDEDGPMQTRQTFWVRLVDQQNLPLSPRIYFDTYDDCEKNLTIINFKQVQ